MGIGLLSVGRTVKTLLKPEKSSIKKETPICETMAPGYFTKEGELFYSLINLAKLADRQKIARITSGEFGELWVYHNQWFSVESWLCRDLG